MTSKKVFLITALLILPSVVYFSNFLIEFGMQNDYSLLPGTFQDRQMHDEFSHQVMIGRVLGGFLLNVLTWCVNSVSGLAVVRFASFILMLGFSGLFFWFLRRRLGVNDFWAALIALSIMMLSTSQLYVIWATNLMPGFLALLLGLLSYFFWDSACHPQKRILPVKISRLLAAAISVFLFLIASFIYPSNALFVFVCTFSIVFFSAWEERRETLKTVVQDVLFFGSNLLIYFLINVFVVLPSVKLWMSFIDVPTGIYKFHLTQNIAGKVTLMTETFLAALGGTWHPVFGNPGAMISATVIFLSGFLILFYTQRNSNRDASRLKWTFIFQKFLIGIILFFLINLPPLLAKECHHLVGYRILFPSAVLLLIWQFGFLQKCAERLRSPAGVSLIKSLAVALVFFSCWIAFQSIYSTAKNLHAELNFIRQKVAAIDFAKYDRVMTLMLRDQEREALAKDSPLYEWDYYRFSPTRMTYIIKYLAKQRGFTKVAVLLDFGDKVFFDQRTALVDFNELFAFSQKRWPSQTTKPLALITASSDSDRQIEISHVTDDFLLFEEVQGQTRKPFWPADFNDVPPPWFQIEFLKNHPKLIRGFAVGAVGPDLNFKPVDWRIQGSFDGNQWVDLDLQRVPLQKQGSGNYIVYMRKNFTPYNRYRFSLNKKDPSENMKVAGIHLDLGL